VRFSLQELVKQSKYLHELCRSVVTKLEFSNTAELSVFELIFVPILTYAHESWVMTEKISQIQAVEKGFLRSVHSVTQLLNS